MGWIRGVLLRARGAAASFRSAPVRLLVAAGLLHFTVTAAFYAIGSNEISPATFDAYGVGVSFAPDGMQHREDAVALSEVLRRGQALDWLIAHYPLHVKVYSIWFALFGPWLGYNVLSVEPLNVSLYLAILILVFEVGREAFGQGTGLTAAAAVALWPSFLLHTTQFLKDPLFVAGMLALVLIVLRYLTRNFSWVRALLTGAVGGLLAAGLWLARDNMGEVVVAAVVLGAVLLIAAQFRKARVQATNLAGMALLMALTVVAQWGLPKVSQRPLAAPATAARAPVPDLSARAGGTAAAPAPRPNATAASVPTRTGLVGRVSWMRRRFINRYPNSGSNIDVDVQLNSTSDLVRYLPRAAAIGLFAPFPHMWLGAGKQVGSAGRLLGGAESLAMYAVEALALLGLWRARRRPSAWLLFLVALVGLIGLGLVVVNAGALFRLRYVFLILLIILGAEGAANVLAPASGERGGGREGQPITTQAAAGS